MYASVPLFIFPLGVVYGDVHSRKSTAAKREAEIGAPQCLVRASTSAKSDTISTVVDASTCDMFHKRVAHVVRSNLLKSKFKKSRAGSQ